MAMQIVNIENLRETDPGLAIEIRVIRRWVTRLVPDETCYIFADKYADGIHAVAAPSYKSAYDNPLALQGCYRILCFSCDDPPTYLKTIDRPISLRFGSTATVTPLEDSLIYPKLYFDFTEYENLVESTPAADVFTDFIGLIDHVVDAKTQDNAPYIRLFLKDGRNSITATLWKEIIVSNERFSRTALDATPRPCTIAVTAVKVSKHKGWFQLTSTPATYTYINPVCDQSTRLIEAYVSHLQLNNTFLVYIHQSSLILNRNQLGTRRPMLSRNILSSSTSIEKKSLSSLLELDHQQLAVL
ncbi:hypothetical protein SSX86_025754 [Deinandra increscens subsp. villosa]|uniref:Nucleic acid-binding protein n=1 Tax=Deinandra increscens subsp. villosa TaxID=3103831 RepID=A0AAP0GPF5_9ASTR